MSHLRTVPPKESNYQLALMLDELLKVIPMVEQQRDVIKKAADRLRYQDD